MPDLIHIYHNNQQEGPYSPEQIHDMIARGAVTPVSLAWKEGMPDWAPLNTIISCDEVDNAIAPPLPPPIAHPAPQPSVVAPAVAATGPKGVGGWLLFFCVSLTILNPFFFLGCFAMFWAVDLQPMFDLFPNLKNAVICREIGSVALIIYGFIVGCMIWSGNPSGREIAKKYLLINLFGAIGIEFIVVVIRGDMPAQVAQLFEGNALRAIFSHSVGFLVWWFYFKKSKRVRNTYGVN